MLKKGNLIANLLSVCALIVFVIFFIVGICLFDGPLGDFAGMFGAWIIGFVNGLFILAFAEVIELLDKINKK
ncbi:MAG: hypothetical protein E7411_07520 [Ruminococcaceae bacterium]|nr:hypothetical protein [Oscillospiraceae bacterium]